MACEGLAILPFILAIWTISGLVTSLVIYEVLHQDPKHILPTISYLGNFKPQIIIHAVVITISTILGIVTAGAIYRFMQLKSQMSDFNISPCCAKASFITGCLWCIGFEIAGIVPSNQYGLVHAIGGGGAYLFGEIYIISLAVITYRASPRWNSKTVCNIRIGLASITLIFLLPFAVCTIHLQVKGYGNPTIYFITALFEWLSTFGLLGFMLTFFPEFQQLTFRRPDNWKENWIVLRQKIQDPEDLP
ncbi:DNA damage-regulated autophagy modulator protein 1-like [Pelobates fuscus]|uniref:DNA damage-regulated autophagy modulator protein 1-like n=1 Tax=Pelobates fuscus TaxID=191477 RepID=UPI002FE4B40F